MDIQAYFPRLFAGDAACPHMWRESTRQSEVSSQGIFRVGPHLELRLSSRFRIRRCLPADDERSTLQVRASPLTWRRDLRRSAAPASFNLTRRCAKRSSKLKISDLQEEPLFLPL